MKSAERLKREIALEYGIPLTVPPAMLLGSAVGTTTAAAEAAEGGDGAVQGGSSSRDKGAAVVNLLSVRRAATVLRKFGDRLPADRKRCVALAAWPAAPPARKSLIKR